MCIAELNRSVTSCGHTYFRLDRSCGGDTSLANCNKLSLSGWENRTEVCVVCNGGTTVDPMNFRVLGSEEPFGMGGNISRTNSLSTMTTSSLTTARRESRRSSLAPSDSSSGNSSGGSFGLVGTTASPVNGLSPMNQLTSERNISQGQRIEAYLSQLPETVSRAGQQSSYYDRNLGGRSRAGSTSSTTTGNTGAWTQYSDGDRRSAMSRLNSKGRRLSRDIRSFF